MISLFMRPNRKWSPHDLLDVARGVSAVGKPSKQTSYASPGYYLLGLLLEEVSGDPYHLVVRREVFEPLGMTHTYEANNEWSGDLETLKHYAGWFDLSDNDPSFEFADGGFVSTTSDLTRFGLALVENRLFKQSQTTALFFSTPPETPEAQYYQGLGPRIELQNEEVSLAYHAGFWGVYFIASPSEGWTAAFSLGQSGADSWSFWERSQELIQSLPDR